MRETAGWAGLWAAVPAGVLAAAAGLNAPVGWGDRGLGLAAGLAGGAGAGPLTVLAEPLHYPFMVRALWAGILVAIAGAVTGSFLLVRRWSLLGDAISHAVLPGVALSYLVGWPYFVGAMVTGLLTAAGIGFLERNTRLKSDAATGLLFLGAFAAGLAILSRVRSSVDIFHILFGNVLGVAPSDLVLMGVVALASTGLVVALFKELQLWAFDPLTAQVAGLPVRALHYLLTLLVSATIVAALQAVGVVLALAMLITPPATAYLLSRRFPTMILLAAAIGALSAVTGLYLSFYLNVASGAAMVLVATATFVLALLLAPEQGLLARAWERRRLAGEVAAEDVLKALDELGGHGAPVALAALAQWTGLPRRTVHKAVGRLVAAGSVEPVREVRADGRPGGAVRLTAAGLQRARRLIRAHRLWERYLTDVAGMGWEDVHEVAHQLEHATPAHLAEEMAEVLGHPLHDPHGAPIPTAGGEVPAAGAPLPQPLPAVAVGSEVQVVRVDDEDPSLLERLRLAGVVPGSRVRVAERGEAGAWTEILPMESTHGRLRLNRVEASGVWVRPMGERPTEGQGEGSGAAPAPGPGPEPHPPVQGAEAPPPASGTRGPSGDGPSKDPREAPQR